MDFTPAGLWQILTALPELKDKEGAFRTAMAAAGYQYDLPDFAGVRSAAQQQQLIAWRDEDVAAGGKSYAVAPVNTTYHQYGAAFDIKITQPADPQQSDYQAAADIAQSVGLDAGFYFTNRDPYHYQLPYDLPSVQQMWTEHTGTVEQVVGGISAGVLVVIGVGLWLLFGKRGG